ARNGGGRDPRLSAAHGYGAARLGGGRCRHYRGRPGIRRARSARAAGVRRGAAGGLIIGALVVIALAGPLFLPDPAAQPDSIGGVSLPPSPEHPFGTDHLSRHVLSRVVHGAR